MRFAVFTFLLSFSVILTPVLAEEDAPTRFQFAQDYIDSLYFASTGSEIDVSKIKPVELAETSDAGTDQESSEQASNESESVAAYESTNAGLEKAKELLAHYVGIDYDVMKTVLAASFMSYKSQIVTNLEGIDLVEQLYAIEGEETYDRKKYMEIQSDIFERRRKAFRLLNSSAVLVTHMLLHEEPDSDGNMTLLGITEDERIALLMQLEERFGEDIKVGLSEDLRASHQPAAILYEFLSNSEFTSFAENSSEQE